MLTTDYINHFGALAMLLEILPDFPDAISDMKDWRPKSYEDHVRAITFTDPGPLLNSYAALDPAIRDSFNATMTEANDFGAMLIRLLDDPSMFDNNRRDLCAFGASTMNAFIQRLTGIIAGVEGDAVSTKPHDMQSQIDELFD